MNTTIEPIKIATKAGKRFFIDFKEYTYLELKINGMTIRPGTNLVDADGDSFTVERILIDSVNLRDEYATVYNYDKEYISRFSIGKD